MTATMGRLIDCQMAFVTWGMKARFRQGKLGLLRKDNKVYLAIFFTKTEYHKLLVDPKSLALLPAAIRFKDMQKDLFIKNVGDTERYEHMKRGIKVLLKNDELRRTGKGDKLDRFIASLPNLNSIRLEERTPLRMRANLIGANGTGGGVEDMQGVCEEIIGSGNDLVTPRQPCSERNNGYGQIATYNNNELTDDMAKRLANPNLRKIKQIRIRGISENLWQAQYLTDLELIECNLNCVPKDLEKLSKSLEVLDLSKNSINKLPRTFCCKMNKLKRLNVSNNLIETLPLEIKFFSNLVVLNLSDNHLRLLPSTFSDLRALKILNLAKNNLSQLPAFKRSDIALETLDISNNPLDGALQNQFSTFEVYPSYDGQLSYEETSFSPSQNNLSTNKNKISKLFEISLLNIVRSNYLFKRASEEALPRSIVSTMQRDVFKCYRCNQMNLLPAYNSTDYLDYVAHVTNLVSTRNYSHGMTFMKLLCRDCFGNMTS